MLLLDLIASEVFMEFSFPERRLPRLSIPAVFLGLFADMRALLKIKKIQADFFAEFPFHRAGDQVQDDFCGGADDCPVQVSAHHMAFRVSGGKVGVQIRRSVFGGEGSRQGNDLDRKSVV